MKKYLWFFIIFISISGCELIYTDFGEPSTVEDKYPGLEGKKYIGDPICPDSCGGRCGEECKPGYFSFLINNGVEFIWPGTDSVNGGNYKQEKYELEINSISGDRYYFTISNDGKEITDNNYGIVFRDENYPWYIF